MSYHTKIKGPSRSCEYAEGSIEPDRLLRLPEVMKRVGLKRSAIYDRMKAGNFPKSRTLGPRYTVWVASEVDAWVNEVIAN